MFETRQCQNCKQEFRIEPEDFEFYEKIHVPPPTWCPECRLRRRYAWRNVRTIYKRGCDLCKKEVVGVYSPDKPHRIYCTKCWWSDAWDARAYGRGYDFSRPFFEQFHDLMKEAPLINRFVYEDTLVNSDYVNMARDLKDCYLVFHGDYCERCYYSDEINYTNDCIDVSYVFRGELCYGSVNLLNCYRVFFSKDSESCQDCYFMRNCVGCSNCFGCVNLHNKQYHIFNQSYTKESYLQKLKELGFSPQSYISVENFRRKIRDFWNLFPVKFTHGAHNVNVSGDYVYNSKNAQASFHIREVEDSKFCAHLVVPSARDSYDWTQYGENGELIYEMLQGGGGIHNDHFGWCIWRQTRNIEYGVLNVNSSECFGCVSVKNKEYCILNKQYTKEEYRTLVPRIIAHMNEMPYFDKKGRTYRYGEFFPINLSPFGYNESVAQEEFPLDPVEVVAEGYAWINMEKYKGEYRITKEASDLPDTIYDVGDDILQQVIRCSQCGRPYRILPQELIFYRNQNLSLPRYCVECRYGNRMQDKNPLKLWHRKCTCAGGQSDPSTGSGYTYTNQTQHFHGTDPCPNEFETSYAPDRREIVYCEFCYQAEVA